MNNELEKLNKQIFQAGVAQRLLDNDDFQEYQKLLDEEIAYYINILVDPKTHPKEYLPIRAEISARRTMRQKLETLVRRKGKMLERREELEAIQDA